MNSIPIRFFSVFVIEEISLPFLSYSLTTTLNYSSEVFVDQVISCKPIEDSFILPSEPTFIPWLNPIRSLGRKWHLFCYFLLPFIFYKASVACFLLEIARYYSQKRQATSALLKNKIQEVLTTELGLTANNIYMYLGLVCATLSLYRKTRWFNLFHYTIIFTG